MFLYPVQPSGSLNYRHCWSKHILFRDVLHWNICKTSRLEQNKICSSFDCTVSQSVTDVSKHFFWTREPQGRFRLDIKKRFFPREWLGPRTVSSGQWSSSLELLEFKKSPSLGYPMILEATSKYISVFNSQTFKVLHKMQLWHGYSYRPIFFSPLRSFSPRTHLHICPTEVAMRLSILNEIFGLAKTTILSSLISVPFCCYVNHQLAKLISMQASQSPQKHPRLLLQLYHYHFSLCM